MSTPPATPEQWVTIDWSEADVSPFCPDEDGQIGFLFGNHRSERPVLIEGRTVPVDCPATIGARIHKLSPTTPHNADALELYPRTTGLVCRASDFEVPLTVRVRRSAWAGRPSAPAPRGRAC